jgi:hypothetical protein
MGATLQNLTKFPWTKVRARAAYLLAADELTDARIAKRLGITRQTLATWKRHTVFRERVARNERRIGEAMLTRSIARRTERIRALDKAYWQLERICRERGASEEMQSVPGGRTGLLVRKANGEYVLDTAMLDEKLRLMRQVAEEVKKFEAAVQQAPHYWAGEVQIDLDLLPEELVVEWDQLRRRMVPYAGMAASPPTPADARSPAPAEDPSSPPAGYPFTGQG